MIKLNTGDTNFKLPPKACFTIYLTLISGIGVLLVGWSLGQFLAYERQWLFLLFLFFAGVAAILTTSMPIPTGSGITYHIGSVIGIATVPIFGISAGIIVVAVQGLCTWLIKPAHAKTWKKSWSQLTFNIGMDSLALLAAGLMLQWLSRQLAEYQVLQTTVPWLVAAVVYSEVNLWLLIGVLRLQQGKTLQPLTVWREEHWSTQIDVILMCVGGALLAFVGQRYDWVGLLAFFLPIALSAYAFRLYSQQMQAHLDNLDQIVNERTASLRTALAQRQVEMEERQRAEAELRRLATYDALTNALNRRAFWESAHSHFAQAEANHTAFSILMFDLDRFKQINDRYGHAAGDAALQYFAKLCMAVAPASHIFGRLGGEEFAMLLPETDNAGAMVIGETIRRHAPATALSAGGSNFTVTVSIGVATAKMTDQRVEQVLERADQRLYRAKHSGRNCVIGAAIMPHVKSVGDSY